MAEITRFVQEFPSLSGPYQTEPVPDGYVGTNAHGSLIFIEVFKIYKLLNLLKLEKLFFVGSPIVTTLGGSWAVITAIYMVLFGLNFCQNRPFFALQKSNFGFAFENERTVRIKVPIEENSTDTS